MVILNDILYVSFADLIAYGYNEDYLKRACRGYRAGEFSAYANIPDPTDARKKLIEYRSLPAKAIVEHNMPSEEQLRATLSTRTLGQEVDAFGTADLRYDKALNFFKSNAHTNPYAQELAQQATWLLFLAASGTRQAKALGYGSVKDLYDDAIKICAEQEWQRWKISGVQYLQRKLKPFTALFKPPLKGAYTDVQMHQALESLVHRGFGNNNREKLTEEMEACIFTLYANGQAKLNEVQVHAMYLNMASRKISAGEWDTNAIISLSTIKNFLNRDDIKQAYWKHRHGKQAYRAQYEIITHRRPPTIANALWVMDGSPVHRYYIQNGRAYSRLNAYVIIDAHSWCVVGFYVSETETTEAVKGSLRSACELTQYRPHQIMFDHSSANMSYEATMCMEAITKHVTPTMVGNARAKIIEPFFKHLNSQVLRFRPGYTHSPVMANNINGKPNPEALQQALKEGNIPATKEQAIRELHEDFAIWNNKSFKGGKSPLQRYKESIEAHADLQLPYTHQHQIEGFYSMPGTAKQVKGVASDGTIKQITKFIPQPYLYTNDGIAIVIEKTKHVFQTDNPEFNRQYLGKSFFIKYDPVELQQSGLKQIYLYESTSDGARPFMFDGVHACLRNPNLFAHALIDRVAGEGHALHEHLQNKKVQAQKADEVALRYARIAKSTGSFVEIRAENAYPKEVLNAAKQQLAEQIINGDQHRLLGPTEADEENKVLQSNPTNTPEEVVRRRRSRWDSD